jgi:hypothetical protein
MNEFCQNGGKMDSQFSPESLTLLKEIKASISDGPYTKYIIAAFGMIGIILGQGIQLLIAKVNASHDRDKQKIALRAEIITKQRQEWMDSIRDAATEFLVACDTIYNSKTSPTLLSDDQKIESALKALSKVHYIELKLNKDKPLQGNSIHSMRALHNVLNSDFKTINLFSVAYQKASSKFKDDLVAMFHETWGRIKNLE